MSLLKRLLLTVSVAILIILSGTLALSMHAARQYLDGQLQSQSENAVSALALSLSQPANQDEVMRELLMMALFDTGQFRTIRLLGVDGSVLFERSHPDTNGKGSAPTWFAQLLPLRMPVAQRGISDGWKQVGMLSVTVDNTFARDALWHSSIRMGLLVLVAGGLWALSVVGLLTWFRRVLREEIAAQVESIGRLEVEEYDAASKDPFRHSKVAELSAVVHAISDTRERVRATAQEQTQRIESMEVELNRDEVTKLPNRRYFLNELRRVLQGGGGGHVLLFRQRDLQALNTFMTRAPADAWLTGMAARIGLCLKEQGPDGALVARLNGSDFIVLMPNLEGPEAIHLVQQIKHELQAIRQPISRDGQWCRWAYALTDYANTGTVSELLSRLDQGLRRSESAGLEEVEYVTDTTPRNTSSERQWQQTLQQAIEGDRLSLNIEVLRYATGSAEIQRYQASLSLQELDGSSLQGTLFLPVAVRLGMSADFDLRSIQLALQWLKNNADADLIVMVSLPSLTDEHFVLQLKAMLGQAGGTQHRLWVELDAYGLLAYPEEVRAFASAVAEFGVHIGIRRLEHAPLALSHLHLFPLSYVKLGNEFAIQANSSHGSLYLLQAMVNTAQILSIQVFVVGYLYGDLAKFLKEKGVWLSSGVSGLGPR